MKNIQAFPGKHNGTSRCDSHITYYSEDMPLRGYFAGQTIIGILQYDGSDRDKYAGAFAREEFEKWYTDACWTAPKIGITNGNVYLPSAMQTAWEAWQEQQKKIDDLQLLSDIRGDIIQRHERVIKVLREEIKAR